MSQDNIFREVDEELRSDRMRSAWRRFGPFVIGAAVLVVVLVGVNEGWSWYQSSKSAASSDKLYTAFTAADGGDVAAAKTALDDLIATGAGGYPTLAKFREAGLLVKAGKAADAITAYDQLANDETNPRLRELALVLSGTLQVDNGTLADVEARVQSLANDTSPMRNAAREAMGLAQYEAQKYTDAQASFEAALNDPSAPDTVRNRMNFYLAQMLSEGLVKAKSEADVAADAIDKLVNSVKADPANATDTPAGANAPAATPATDAAPVVEK
ncbi:tetratricopeptide repeat protein [Devosia sp.]|uniref:tetratricopeptide repeat protein n=1 Tax=Devosia sp. TaxID=1871048 RepID=UPI003265AA5C